MPTSPTPVSPAPAAPDRANRATFPAAMYAFFVYMKDTFVTGINALATNVYNNAVVADASALAAGEAAAIANSKAILATDEANAAAASAITAVSAPGTSATSATNLSIGMGSKELTVQAGKLLVVGMTVKITMTASPTVWMAGDVTGYNDITGALVVIVTAMQGTGAATAWTVSLSGAIGLLNVGNDQFNLSKGVI